MSISYVSLSRRAGVFKRLTGLSIAEFNAMVNKVRPAYDKKDSTRKAQGRPSRFETLEDRMLCVFIYYRTYVSQTFVGYLFNVHNANVCRMLKKLEPLVAEVMAIKKDRTLTEEKVMSILADVTEIPTQRPKKN